MHTYNNVINTHVQPIPAQERKQENPGHIKNKTCDQPQALPGFYKAIKCVVGTTENV